MSEKYDFDVLYLGNGHGTFNGAAPLAAKGFKVGIISGGKFGGTCPNRGCNAKIALDMPDVTKHNADRLEGSGLDNTGAMKINWTDNVKHKDQVIDVLPAVLAKMMTDQGIQIIDGFGKLTDAHTIEVDGKSYTADKIVLATGAHYHRLNIPGDDLAIDGTQFMDIKKQPKSMTVIGSGFIAMEFANIATDAGTDVTVLMHHDVALAKFYQPFVKELIAELEKQGVKFETDVTPSAIEKDGDGLVVKTDKGDFNSEIVLDATGRPANVENLGLEEVGVKFNKNGIEVNDYLQTTVDNIYADGDCIDKKVGKLTPTAIFESMYLTQLFSGETKSPIEYPAVPAAVFTLPRISQIGVSPAEAKKEPDKYKVQTIDLATDWYRATRNENKGTCKIVYDNKGVVVGAVEISDQADNAISTMAPAIEYKLTPKQRQDFIPLFPTIGSETWTKM